jgi:hypothetical protein
MHNRNPSMARVVPEPRRNSTLSLESAFDNNNNNNNIIENEEVWGVNLEKAYTKSNIPRLLKLNAIKRYKEYGNAIPSMRNEAYEIAVKAFKNEEKSAMSMFNKKSRRLRRLSARRLTRRRR